MESEISNSIVHGESAIDDDGERFTVYFTALEPSPPRSALNVPSATTRTAGATPVSHTIRPLTASDFPAWLALRIKALDGHPDAFGSSSTDEWVANEHLARKSFTERSIAGENAIFGAFDEAGNLVGVTGFVRESGTKSRHRAFAWGVYVAPAARGAGLATRLMQAVIAHARSVEGVTQLELTAASHNTAAISVYKKLGFTTFGRHPRALMLENRPIDEDLMVLILDAPATDAGSVTKGVTT
jgi:RimJ/RimL family protein N-acetyltransferase